MKRLVATINTLGLLGYLYWVGFTPHKKILYSRDGIIYVVPFLLFFFVYLSLFRGQLRGRDEVPDLDQDRNQTRR
ncbi:MAG TPA: hypothetical protein P5567_02315 [Kiritimatiellia bacterium]|nr:hypothetical protein [Kiritimatiellia bacterium]HSA19118.1 hypothetical protein [Kiritimatiellia bacterium]